MPKRKKYPKLPNGYGSIKYLGKGRRNPYAVHPPTQDFALSGSPITPKALCYTDAWIKGFTVLTAYKAGTYYPGMELELNLEDDSTDNLEALAQKLLADYNATRPVNKMKKEIEKTFAQVYDDYFDWKYNQDKSRDYSSASMRSTKAAYKNCFPLHDRTFSELRHPDLQKIIDDCKLKHASLELIVSLYRQMYTYAISYELVDKDYSTAVKINIADDDEHGIPFTDDELKTLWNNQVNPIVELILIMCYSGFRIKAYRSLETNLCDLYFKGGVKTRTSKNRIVPIHSAIQKLVKRRISVDGCLLNVKEGAFRIQMYSTLEELKLPRHTPHDCRHTFSRLCEKFEVNENDRKRMLGHSFGNDITNSVYGHRSLGELRTEIEKIKICY